MKRLLTLAFLVAALGGCAIVPLGYPGDGPRGHEHRDWNYREYGGDDGYRWHDRRGGRAWEHEGYRR